MIGGGRRGRTREYDLIPASIPRKYLQGYSSSIKTPSTSRSILLPHSHRPCPDCNRHDLNPRTHPLAVLVLDLYRMSLSLVPLLSLGWYEVADDGRQSFDVYNSKRGIQYCETSPVRPPPSPPAISDSFPQSSRVSSIASSTGSSYHTTSSLSYLSRPKSLISRMLDIVQLHSQNRRARKVAKDKHKEEVREYLRRVQVVARSPAMGE